MKPKPFLKVGYRVAVDNGAKSDHWLGGKPLHPGAKCPVCRIPLLLLWDLDCNDPKFPQGAFGQLRRLPLYFCWGCVGDLSYRTDGDGDIVVTNTWRSSQKRSFPYKPYPRSFERQRLALLDASIPPKIERSLNELDAYWAEGSDDDDDSIDLPNVGQRLLSEYFGHIVTIPRDAFHHQFGGAPRNLGWREEIFECHNPDCHGSVGDRLRRRKHRLSFLAGILNDPWRGLPMAEPADDETKRFPNFWVTVQFHICDRCWTILGVNRGGG